VKVNITVQVQDLSTKKPIDNLTQQRFSAPSLSNFQHKAIGLYSMDIQLASAGPKKGTAQMQVCAPGFLCKTQEVEAPDPPGSVFTFQLRESSPLETKISAKDGANLPIKNGNSTLSDSITFFATTSGGQPPYGYIYTVDSRDFPVTSSSQETIVNIPPGIHDVRVLTRDANGEEDFADEDPFVWTIVQP
jgi:hypothetical protein